MTAVDPHRAARLAADFIERRRAAVANPIIVAIDGRSGVGKSTMARSLAVLGDTRVIEGDDFFAGGVEVTDSTPEALAARCIDWRRQRRVLGALRDQRSATYRAFDWEAFDGSMCRERRRVTPARTVILEGVYSARPELADLVDLRILLRAPEAVRLDRLIAREDEIGPWEKQWHAAEEWYFRVAAPLEAFDMVIDQVG